MTIAGKIPSPAPGVPDAYTQAPPVFKAIAMVPAKGGKISIFQVNNQTPVPPRDQNRYWQELEKRIGAQLEIDLVPSASYPEKLAATTAGGNLADLMYVDLGLAPDQAKVIQQGAYTDLTPFLTGDGLKEFPNLAAFPERSWKNAMIRGKIYGVPRVRWFGGAPLMFRQDWADSVGVSAPKNADEFANLLTRFVKNDPDGNGMADTFGLTSKLAGQGVYDLDWISGMFRTPNNWHLNADGTLNKDLETDAFKQTVTYIKRLFDAGVYHPNAATMTTSQAKDAFISGKVGGYYDSTTAVPGLRRNLRGVNPAAHAVGLVPMGFDGGNAVTHNGLGFFGWVSIPAKVGKDTARVKELLRVLDYYAAPFGSEEYIFLQFGLEGVHHTLQPDGNRLPTDQGKREISDTPTLVNAPQVCYYPDGPGDAAYMQGMVRDIQAIGIDDPTASLFSPTNTMKAGELQQLQIDRLGAIITGRAPLSDFDAYVKDWRARGGDQIRKEYEQALKA